MAKYDISKQALEDLYKIWEYAVDTWSETQADKYYGHLEEALDKIGTDPQKSISFIKTESKVLQ
ncbi:MAG: type II toxin-antitoxin system RelE/ParE family toxin [Bacteroidaceae bacterium]|nr:type II toxin-antitoxin system RelE/ParE family toxin [Bacteroidaceae bacterium]